MKNKLVLFIIALCFSCNDNKILKNNISNNISKKIISETSEGEKILLGEVTHFQIETFANKWFSDNDFNNLIDEKIILKILPIIKNVSVKIFLGTWCEDSEREIPVLFHILKKTNFDLSSINIIALSEFKTSPQNFEKNFNITNVPTIIFLKENKEINRIVEFPVETMEKDIYNILSVNNYKHAYLE